MLYQRRFALFLCACMVALGAKPIDLEVTSMKLQRQGDLILVDTTIKNASAKPIRGLTAIFRFYSPSHEVMSTQRTKIDEPILEAGAETEIHAQLTAPPKAVTAELGVEVPGTRQLQVGNAGPFMID